MAQVEGKGVAEQVRGMKVRSSVKKLCEGCKVCFSLARSELGVRRGREEGVEEDGEEGMGVRWRGKERG